MLWYLAVALYFLVWAALLVHCLRRRYFYPLFGSGWGTKALWLTTFLFLSPPLTLFYIIFGVTIKPKERHKQLKLIRPASVLVIALIAFVIVAFEIGGWSGEEKPAVFSNGVEQEKSNGFNFHAQTGILEANNNLSTSTSSSHISYARFAGRSAIVICNGKDQLLRRVAKNLAKSLSEMAFIDTVEYYPAGMLEQSGKRMNDINVKLSMVKKDETQTPVGRKLDAVFTMEAGRTLFEGSSYEFHGMSPPVLNFNMQSTLEHTSKMNGYESRQAKYTQQADSISQQFTEAIDKQFKQWINKFGLMPKLPDVFYGKYEPAPEFAFLAERNAMIAMARYGLMQKNRTIWQYKDQRPTREALTAIADELKAGDWQGGDGMEENTSNLYLRMTKGNERIYAFRQRARDVETGREIYVKPEDEPDVPDTLMVFHYEKFFDKDEIKQVTEFLLSEDTPVDTLLMFSDMFSNKINRKKLAETLEKKKHLTFDGYLHLAQYWQSRNEIEKAKTSFVYARAMSYTAKEHDPRNSEIRQLAKKLGDKELAKTKIDKSIFVELGFLNINDVNENTEIIRNVGEGVSFYQEMMDGKIKIFTVRVVPGTGKNENEKYRLQDVTKEEGATGRSERGGYFNNDKWTAQITLYEDKKNLSVQVAEIEEGVFNFKLNYLNLNKN